MSIFVESEFDQNLVEMLHQTTPPGQYAARNAIRHLDKAGDIGEVDPEMAALRAITAEEEAATAVFHALRRHVYPGSEHLKVRDHLQKNALAPFAFAVARLFAWAEDRVQFAPQLSIVGVGNERRLTTRIHLGVLGLDGYASPQPPLNLEIRRGDMVHDFGQQLGELAEALGVGSILTHLKARANMRNQILYASPAGVPSVVLNSFLAEQRRRVKVNVGLFLLIDPYTEHQLFAQQALRAFLKMLDRLPDDLAF